MANKPTIKQCLDNQRIQRQMLEQEQLIGYWIKKYGITRRVLNNHPSIEDLALLIKVREYLAKNQKFVNKKQNKIIGNIWQVCYNRQSKLFRKHYTTLENIVLQVETKAFLSAQKNTAARQKIAQARVKT
jgi:hypothetical protein